MSQEPIIQNQIKESSFAKFAYYASYIPLVGLLPFVFLASVAIIQMGKGMTGGKRISKGVVLTVIFTIIPLAVIYSLGFSKYFPFLPKHGAYWARMGYPYGKECDLFSFGNHYKKYIYFQDDAIYSEQELKYGRNHGVAKFWYSGGSVNSVQKYHENILLEETIYYKGGRLKELSKRENDVFTYKTEFYPDGKMKSEGRLKDGYKYGKWIYGEEDGTLREELEYKDMQTTTYFYSEEKAEKEIREVMNKKYGYSDYWYKNGNRQKRVPYENDLLNGTYFEYYEDGGPKVKGEYRQNKMSGLWQYWADNGRLLKEEHYDDSGKLVSTNDFSATSQQNNTPITTP